MEAFALRRIQKENEIERLKSKKDEGDEHKMSQKEIDELNKQFGYPDPPTHVCAIGKPESAAVWWLFDESKEKEIIGWEIFRYRRDLNGSSWSMKGSISMKALSRKQVMLENLTNGFEYRFTVRSINTEGSSAESPPSNAVVIEASLPSK